jgi:ankyrin repeat protein
METKMLLQLKCLMIIAAISPLLPLAACQNTNTKNNVRNAEQQQASPKEDIHTAVVKNNIEAIKQHIADKSNLNLKEPYGGSTPLISAALFGRQTFNGCRS